MKKKRLFSLSVSDAEYLKDSEEKIEVLSCPAVGKDCKNQLSVINNNFVESYSYHRNKEYERSIEALKSAFNVTGELQDLTCRSCAKLFQSTITQSLEKIHDELHGMSNGIFKTKRYQQSYVYAGRVLNDFKGNR